MARFDRPRPGRHVRDRTEVPRRAVDAPYARVQSAVVPAGVVGLVGSDEAIAAATGFSMLAGALHALGLNTETRGYFMRVSRPGGDGQAGRRVDVVLGHHPADGERLWWWHPVVGAGSPDGAWGPAGSLRMIGPIDAVATAADHVARALRADAEAERSGQTSTVGPAHDWG